MLISVNALYSRVPFLSDAMPASSHALPTTLSCIRLEHTDMTMGQKTRQMHAMFNLWVNESHVATRTCLLTNEIQIQQVKRYTHTQNICVSA